MSVERRPIVVGLALLAALTMTTAAKADPCKAIPDHGPMPSYLHRGAHFSGPWSMSATATPCAWR